MNEPRGLAAALRGGTFTRLVAAGIGLAVLLPAVLGGGPLAVEIIVPLVAMLAVAEYAAMAFPHTPWAAGAVIAAGFGAVHVSAVTDGDQAWVVGVLTVGVLAYAAFSAGPVEAAADKAGRLLVGIGYVSLLTPLVLLRREPHGLGWVFLVLAASWLGDTGAYFAGRLFGRHALVPRISPKKTWEGVAGGIAAATLGAFVIRALALPELSIPELLVLGPVLCVVGVVGDLGESMLKRSFAVKDSGWIMPGHGGLLDRIDSVLFVAPVLYAWVVWMEAR